MYKPRLRGGALQYTVNLKHVRCGCVAGVYAVKVNDKANPDVDIIDAIAPNCATIDIMEANIGGFGVAANPCDGGQCDPVS